MLSKPAFALLLALLAAPAAAPACDWQEPPRTYPEGTRWSCVAVAWMDGDTFAARCDGHDAPVSVRFGTAPPSLRVGTDPARALPAGVSLAVVAAGGEGAAITFLPDGSSTGGRVELAGAARRVQVGVDWLTGRVVVADGP